MIEDNRFESSTFQEDKGFSGVPGFQGKVCRFRCILHDHEVANVLFKVVDDDSSEMGRNDRNDHINKNHMDMCKFFGLEDHEYEKVAGEINRNILRLRNQPG
jgi:hypothetical protein